MGKEENFSRLLDAERILLAACTAASFLIIFWLLKYAAYGLDFTDEGFYITWIANPFIYKASTTQFGFIYHPLYKLVNADLVMLRRANILITFFLAWVLVYRIWIKFKHPGSRARIAALVISSGFATSALICFQEWLITPNYNSLNLQSLIMAVIGLSFLERDFNFKSIIGWILLGFSGWLAFMAKPTTSFAMSVLVLIHLAISGNFSLRSLLLAIGSFILLFVIGAYLIDGSIKIFVSRINLGLNFVEYLHGGFASKIWRIDDFQLDIMTKKTMLIMLILGSWVLWGLKKEGWVLYLSEITILLGLLSAALIIVFNKFNGILFVGQFRSFLVIPIAGLAILAFFLYKRQALEMGISRQQFAFLLLFLLIPYAYAFGTGNNYWQAAGSAAFFWILSGLVVFFGVVNKRGAWLYALVLAISAQAVSAVLINTGMERPYRQAQSLRLNSAPLNFNSRNTTLHLSQDSAGYISEVLSVAKTAKFSDETPVIDLTGQSPTILYLMKAESIGQAWNIGGYPGSLKLAEATLNFVPCEKIAAAWLLIEPNGPRSISTELITNFGVTFPLDYLWVGEWQTSVGAGGYSERRVQVLYKPINEIRNIISCENIKKNYLK